MNPQRILILKPSSLGDVATALPLAVDLHAALPEAQIDWLIHPGLRELVRGHAALHETIDFDRRGLAAWWRSPRAHRALRALLGRLRHAHYDCVIDAQGLLRSGLLARITGAPIRIGFADAREGATLCYTHKVVLPSEPRVGVIRMRALLQPLGIAPAEPARAQVPIDPAARAAIAARLASDAPYAVVISGARWDTKRWSPDGFREICQRLIAAGLRVVLVGSKDEAPLSDQIAAHFVPAPGPSQPLLNLAGQTSLAEMIALLAGARIVVGNDSGPLHVAVALERPIVGIYGPTDPRFVGPYGQLDHVVRFDVACHPCRRKTCDHHSCMRGVTVDAVWQCCRAVLAASESSVSKGSCE